MNNLTTKQTKDLVNEYVSFRVNEMTKEEMASYVYKSMRQEAICQRNHISLQESLKEQIDEYDDNLYEVLVPYVKDEDGSYEVMQEFIHDRHANDWIDN